MKAFKKAVALLVVASILLLPVVKGAELLDIEGSHYKDEINVLVAIGLIQGYKDGSFKPDQPVTRAEMAAILVRCLGLGNYELPKDQTIQFKDVPENHPLYSSLCLVYHLGIIKGSGDHTIEPDGVVTYDQAVTMLINILGYGPVAEVRGGYPGGYQMVAHEEDILKGINLPGDHELKRAEAAKLIYNALEVPMMERISYNDKYTYGVPNNNGNTILSINGIGKSEGQVVANEYTSLVVQGPAAGEGKIKLGEQLYEIQGDEGKYLGYDVTLYYDMNYEKTRGIREVLYVMPDDKSETLSINTEDLKAYSNHHIEYLKDEDSREKEAAVAEGASFIYNGKAVDFNSDLLMDAKGEVILLNSGKAGNSDYDVVFVYDFSTSVVESVDLNANKIILKEGSFNDNSYVPIGDSTVDIVVYKNGNTARVNDITGGNIISVAGSLDNTLITIYVSDRVVSGKVEEVSEGEKRSAVIDQAEYDVLDSVADISVDLEGDFYLDYKGRIAYIDTDTQMSAQNYGFLIKMAKESGISGNWKIKMFTNSGKIVTFSTASKFFVDDLEVNTSDQDQEEKVEQVLQKSAAFSGEMSQVIKYDLNGKGEIRGIYTTQSTSNVEDEKIVLGAAKAVRVFKRTMRTFGDFLVDDKTMIWYLPGSAETLDKDKYYSIKKVTAFGNDASYTIEAYDLSDAGVAKLVAVYPSGTGAVDIDTRPVIVDKVVSAVNSDGERQSLIYAYNAGVLTKYYSDDLTLSEYLSRGDIVKVALDAENKVSTYEMVLDINSQNGIPDGFITDMGGNSGKFTAQYRAVFGSVMEKKGNAVLFTNNPENPTTRLAYDISGFKILLYDMQKDKVRVMNASEVDSYVYKRNASARVFMYTRYGDPRDMVVYLFN